MKKATKFGCSLLAVACAVTSMGALVGCKKTPDTDQTLEVKLAFSGYGVDFAKNMLDGFQKQDWVKAKYPNLEVIVKEDIDTAGVLGTITAGAKNNTADLIFSSANAYAIFDKINSDDGKYYLEDLHDVFYATVPGEDVLVKDKMLDAVEQGCAPTIIDHYDSGYKKYQFIPGQAGTNGLYINLTYLKELSKATGVDYIGTDREKLPATTDELLKLVDDIEKAGKNGNNVKDAFGNMRAASPIVSTTSNNYWGSAFSQWWSQYQGEEDYSNYFWMDDGYGERTETGWLQYGRLESFKVMEQILTYKNGYIDSMSSGVNYIESEKYFFNRGAAMMFMGDWLEEELEVANAQVQDEIFMIDTPVISAIVDVCSEGAFPSRYDGFNFQRDLPEGDSHKYGKLAANGKPIDYSEYITTDKARLAIDARLAFIVKMLRTAEKPTLEEVNAAYAAAFTGGYKLDQQDLDLLYRAANYESLFASSEQWYIPSYAKAKAVAKDFLIYMATDEAIELAIKGNNTLTVFEMSEELQAKLIADADVSPLVKERIKNVDRKITATLSVNPYDYRAGLRALNENYLVESQFLDKANYRDAYTMWELEYQKGKGRMNDWAAAAGITKDDYQSAPYLHD